MTPTPDQTPERRDADCPICGKFARNWNSNNCKLSCSDTSCPGFKIDLHPNEWNHRPLEDALRATNATLAERVRRLEEALTALMYCANAAAEWCNTSMMDDEIMHAQLILVHTPGAAVGKEGE